MFIRASATRDQARFALLLLAVLATAGCAPRICAEGDLTRGHPEFAHLTSVVEAVSWTKHAQVCQVGCYVVAVPADGEEPAIVLSRDNQPVLWVERGIGVTLFHVPPTGGHPGLVLNYQAPNEDGVFGRLSYMTFDASGHPLAEFIDLNLDGEADLKILQPEGTAFARIEGQWMLLEKGKLLMGDGSWKIVQWNGQRWVVQP